MTREEQEDRRELVAIIEGQRDRLRKAGDEYHALYREADDLRATIRRMEPAQKAAERAYDVWATVRGENEFAHRELEAARAMLNAIFAAAGLGQGAADYYLCDDDEPAQKVIRRLTEGGTQ